MTKTFDNISSEKKQHIIDVAIDEFGTYGYELASTNRIVKALNISKGSLFKYFPTKLELYVYLVHYATECLTEYIDAHIEIASDQNWRKQLLKYCEVEFDFLILKPQIYKFFYKVISEFDNPLLKNIKDSLIGQSSVHLLKIYETIKIDPTLYEHIFFIIKGYNEQFMNTDTETHFDDASKKKYLIGLGAHFDLIKA